MIIFLQEDHELPTIDGVARIRGGARSEPAAKVGLTGLYGEVWRTGGTKSKPATSWMIISKFAPQKLRLAANDDSTTISLSCLKDDFNDVFKIIQ